MGTSFFAEILLGATATAGLIYSFGNGWPLLYFAVPVAADLIGKMIGGSIGTDTYSDTWNAACGSAFLKIPLYPFEKL